MIHISQRLYIREFQLADDAFILRLLNEEMFLKFIGDKQVRKLKDARQYLIKGPLASYRKFGFGPYMVALSKNETPIGMCGLLKRDELAYPDLGFAFLSEYCGKGFAYEASRAVLDTYINKGYQGLVSAVTLPSNEKSNKLLTRLGFSLRGDVELYGRVNNLYEYQSK